MRRPNREINVFNMSMLDVICSALGAILILFIIALEAQEKSQAKAEDWQQKYQTLEEKVQAQQEAMQAQQQELVSQQETMQAQQKTISSQAKRLAAAQKKAQGAGPGMAIGMCEVKKAKVKISIYDHGSEDDDRVHLKLNKKTLSKSMVIRNQPTSKSIKLKRGVNYLVVKALNEGRSSPNTATLVIDPCNDGRKENFIWEMKEGQVRNISVVRK
ncbi:MAG: hypothetical protein OXT09_07835 [Myxococcales bacterium]|nr:hypothetical protein [Myxococcales bacterium]